MSPDSYNNRITPVIITDITGRYESRLFLPPPTENKNGWLARLAAYMCDKLGFLFSTV